MQLRPVSLNSYVTPTRASAVPMRLQQLAPAGASLETLQPFYELGEKLSDDKLRGSLAFVQQGLTTDRGPLGKLPVEERSEVLLTLFKAHPAPRGQGFETCFPGGELSQLAKEIDRFMDANAQCNLGGEMYQVPLRPGQRRASLGQLCKDYAGALDLMKKAPGRISRETEPDDREWALDCVRIEHSHLHRDPARMALFRSLVGTFQNPAAAHVVMVHMESMPVEKRPVYLKQLTAEMAALGPFDSDWAKTEAEGKQIQGLAKSVGMCVAVARPGDVHGELMAQVRELKSHEPADVLRGGYWRGPGDTWQQGMRNDPYTGLEASVDRELAQAVYQRCVDRGESHQDLLAVVKAQNWWEHDGKTSALLAQAMKSELPLAEGLPQVLREYALTGRVEGFSEARASLAESLGTGAIKGDLPTLMKRFELIYTTRTSGGEAREKALKTSLAELLEVASPAKGGVVQTDQAVWVGGVRLRKTRG